MRRSGEAHSADTENFAIWRPPPSQRRGTALHSPEEFRENSNDDDDERQNTHRVRHADRNLHFALGISFLEWNDSGRAKQLFPASVLDARGNNLQRGCSTAIFPISPLGQFQISSFLRVELAALYFKANTYRSILLVHTEKCSSGQLVNGA